MSATDLGSGVSTLRLEVDGLVLKQTEPACAPPFVEPVPCPSDQALTAPLALTDGEHELRATGTDASGNATSVTVPLTTRGGRISTPSPPAGAASPSVPATSSSAVARVRAWFAGKSRAVTRTLRYGQRAVVEGTAVDAGGRAVADATLRVSERTIGVTRSQAATVRTDARGRFSYRLGVGASRVVEFSGGSASARVTVRVRAGVTLRTSTNRVRNGSVLRFSGRVLGRRRALVTIYALADGPRKRIPVETVRAGSDGRFSYTYRFARIAGPSVYRFEARVPKQTGFPYLEGASKRVTVRGAP